MLETSLGDMVFDLHTDLCPKVVRFFSRALFRSLAASLDAGRCAAALVGSVGLRGRRARASVAVAGEGACGPLTCMHC
jgi:hypothetical protein